MSLQERFSELCAALQAKSGATVVPGSETITPTQVRFNVRVQPGNDARRWLKLTKNILILARTARWTTDISRQYFLDPTDEVRWGWRLIFQGQELESSLALLAQSVRSYAIQASQQLEEVPLHGSPNRSRGAGLTGTVPVGPFATRG
jgi:hypothetical protein